jgi:hypothetical protein
MLKVGVAGASHNYDLAGKKIPGVRHSLGLLHAPAEPCAGNCRLVDAAGSADRN